MAKTKGRDVAIAVGGALAIGAGVAVAIAYSHGTNPNNGTLIVDSNPQGIAFSVNTTGGTTPFNQSYPAGTSVAVTMPMTFTDSAGNVFNFQSWSDGSTSLMKQVTLAAGQTASFLANYTQQGLTPTNTTLSASATAAQVGQSVTFTGQVLNATTGTGIPGVSVFLESSTDQATWHSMMTVTTDATGNFTGSGSFSQAGNYFVRARFPGA